VTKQVRLDKINDYTPREIFDFVKAHLLKQGKPARAILVGDAPVTGCVYRTDDGLACAVGCMVPDDAVSEMKERGLNDSTAWDDLILGMHWELPEDSKVRELLGELQTLHDDITPRLWSEEFDHVERIYFSEDRA
jgi:hypothetical protein